MLVWLHLNCQKDLLCDQLYLKRTSLEDKLKYIIFTQSEESTVIQLNVMMVAQLKTFRTLMIGRTGIETSIIQTTEKMIAQYIINLI